jgi:hypothetical protein
MYPQYNTNRIIIKKEVGPPGKKLGSWSSMVGIASCLTTSHTSLQLESLKLLSYLSMGSLRGGKSPSQSSV